MEERYPEVEELYRQYYGRRRLRWLDKMRSDKPKVNLILFVATFLSTFFAGWLPRHSVTEGLWYSTAIISILLAHEMGHYLMCRRHGIRATLPYFIPFPIPGNPFGTLGAVIRMESRIPSRKALFDVAVAGPLAGLVVTLPCIYYGIQLSEVVDLNRVEGVATLGESFLFAQISKLAKGDLAANQDILLHPLAFAGWAGLFVTALNLLPIGQLDGGHIVYALIGRHHRIVALVALAGFVLVCVFVYPGWFLLIVLIFWFGYQHPPTLDERPLDRKRFALGIITLILFLLSFTPRPFQFG